jgi:hypothetical protein
MQYPASGRICEDVQRRVGSVMAVAIIVALAVARNRAEAYTWHHARQALTISPYAQNTATPEVGPGAGKQHLFNGMTPRPSRQ